MGGVIRTYDEGLLKARLRLRRDELDLTVQEVAVRAGMSQSQVSGALSPNMTRPIGLAVLVRLADALECSLDWLIGRSTFAAAPHPRSDADVPPCVGETTAPAAFSGSQPGAVVVLSPDRCA